MPSRRQVVLVLTLLAISYVVGLFAPSPAGFDSADTPAPVRTLSAGISVLAAAAYAYPTWFLVAVAVVFLPFVLSAISAAMPREKDPQRLFTERQRREGFALAGNRCEMKPLLWFRCRRAATQGDHWFPHSKGGATSMGNLVGLCAKCNRTKSARIPSMFETFRLERRRAGYFPTGVDTSVGEKYAR